MDTEQFDYFLVTNGGVATMLSQRDVIVQFDVADRATHHDALSAGDNTRASIMDLDGLLSVSEERPVVELDKIGIAEVARLHDVDVDDLLTKYAERLQDTYDSRTAGDHTFVGVLFMFLQELEGK